MSLLLLQMTVVLLTALGCGWLAQRVGQSRVMGQIAGGILLGPSVLSRVAPQAATALFPPSSLTALEVLSTVGLVLFMFLVGTELDEQQVRRQRGSAALASALSIVLPFALALAIAAPLRARFAPGAAAVPFALFLAIAMSVTAFPVLAQILAERKLEKTPLGTTALLSAAVSDLVAWLLLAVALSLVPHAGEAVAFSWRALWLAVYGAIMFGVVRPLAAWMARRYRDRELSYEAFGCMLALALASAAATEAIGVHPLFGAFVAGLCFPRVEAWQRLVRTRLETAVSLLLLPLFFALTGMRTRLDLLSGPSVWVWTGLVLLVAVAGKMGGAVLGGRWTGQSWRDALALGALLNTRGLVELIVLNIAYQAHVFSPTLFTMLVVMALVTTAMTTPLLDVLKVTAGDREAA